MGPFFSIFTMLLAYPLHLRCLIKLFLYYLQRIGDVVFLISLVSSPMAMPLRIWLCMYEEPRGKENVLVGL